ncbi:hypothetical protein LINPERHAP1_LOCUS42035 [Linum perenne]
MEVRLQSTRGQTYHQPHVMNASWRSVLNTPWRSVLNTPWRSILLGTQNYRLL